MRSGNAKTMRVLIGCECSGVVRDAFIARGHDAWSCDLKPSIGNHHCGDLFGVFEHFGPWDMVIAHPPCTYLSSSGLHWNKRRPERAILTEESIRFVRRVWALPVAKMCLENPRGCINTRCPEMPVPKWIQPFQFGEDASKNTGLWLRGLPPLRHGRRIPGRLVEWPVGSGKLVERWSNQTDSGQNRLGPSETRATERAKTYFGIAKAMAEQWG